jgi:acyl carrier protein
LTNTTRRVCALISRELRVDPDKVVPAARLAEDLAADSLDVTDIIMSVEDLFEITVTDDRLEAARTVADIIAMVEQPAVPAVRKAA